MSDLGGLAVKAPSGDFTLSSAAHGGDEKEARHEGHAHGPEEQRQR